MTLMNLVSRAAAPAFVALASALGAGSASAHHAAEAHRMGLAEGLLHLLTEPDHLLLLGGVAALALVLWRQRRAARRAPPTVQRGKRG